MAVYKEPKFHNKDGTLTRYALSCGYVEVKGKFSLWSEHGVLHVRGLDKNDKQVWKNPETLKEGRKLLRQLNRENPE